jgi:hypothetical protein
VTASPLSYADTIGVLERLQTLPGLVLIGGQALNVWCDLYSAECAELQALAPFTSQDIDFQGDRSLAALCAKSLSGKAFFPTLDDATPNSAIVHYTDSTNEQRAIDFLKEPFGPRKSKRHHETKLSATNVLRGSIEVGIPVSPGSSVGVRVMHPTHCLQSRVYNVVRLPGKDDAHGIRQLCAAILCAREHVRAVAAQNVKNARKLNKRLFGFACGTHARELYARHGIDVFDAVCIDAALPERFHTQGYAEWRNSLARRRGAAVTSSKRRAGTGV